MNRKAQVTLFLLLGAIILIVSILSIIVYQVILPQTVELDIELATCSDGTLIDGCSVAKPFYCSKAEGRILLEQRCFECGCPDGNTCDGTRCVPDDNTLDFNFTVFFVPINYRSTSPAFLNRVGEAIEDMSVNTNLDPDDFVIVDRTLETDLTCSIDLYVIYRFVDDWLQQETGYALPAQGYTDAPVLKYRIIAFDRELQDVQTCGCGFTYLFGDVLYLGGAPCSLQTHIVAHELGHTFGLCEEYDTCLWEQGNEIIPCRNARPDIFNSDCGIECCSESGACCFGKFADIGFNIMGSSNMPPERGWNYETTTAVNAHLCRQFGVCG